MCRYALLWLIDHHRMQYEPGRKEAIAAKIDIAACEARAQEAFGRQEWAGSQTGPLAHCNTAMLCQLGRICPMRLAREQLLELTSAVVQFDEDTRTVGLLDADLWCGGPPSAPSASKDRPLNARAAIIRGMFS